MSPLDAVAVRNARAGQAADGVGAALRPPWLKMSRGSEDTPLLRKEEDKAGVFSRACTYVQSQWPMIVLLLIVIGLGSANRVLYKIQLTPMGNYPLFLGWVTTSPFLLSLVPPHRCSPRPLVAYCLLYWSILSVRRYLGIITPEMMAYSNKYLFMGSMPSCRVEIFRSRSQVSATRRATCSEFSQRGASAASSSLSCRKCVIASLPSIWCTDRLQLIIPITMIVTVVMLKARYNIWQVHAFTPLCAHLAHDIGAQIVGAVVIISGEITSLVPSFKSGTSANVIWIGFFIFSILPSAISFVLKESVFQEHVRRSRFRAYRRD